ncbi:MAG: ribosomal protein S18-alanine N-acetyltransferase [Thermomicrobiales bacterium]|nr:ribosomal protein S18-alanine N-acetyltransferase [Thermomicrobiales bacterium]
MTTIQPGNRCSKEGISILATRFRIEPMEQADVAEVSRVERRCFENPWPLSAYRRELRNLRQNYYIVLRVQPDERETGSAPRASAIPPRLSEGLRARLPMLIPKRSGFFGDAPHIAGFGGMWCVYDEAHITTIGVDPHYRGRGFGELLLLALFDEAVRRGAIWVTLEVRVSNRVAQRLYEKYGMSVQTVRKRYYSDDGEDAYVMWSQSLRDAAYRERINRLREDLRLRLGPEIEVPDPPTAPWRGPEPL